MKDTFAVSVRMAGMLLLDNTQITIEEIEALPFIGDRQEAYAVAQRLIAGFASTYGVEVSPGPWEYDGKIRLVSNDKAKTSPDHAMDDVSPASELAST